MIETILNEDPKIWRAGEDEAEIPKEEEDPDNLRDERDL